MKQEIKERIEQINNGIVPGGYKKTSLGVIPIGWDICKFSYMFSRLMRKNKENNSNVLTISAQHGLISQMEFFNKDVSSEDKSNYYLLYKGDFAYNKSYSSGYPFGTIKRLSLYEKGVVSPLYICMQKTDRNLCPDVYLQYFEAGLFNREIKAIAQEGARNHGLLNISVDDFFNTTIMFPPYEEQERIAEILSTQDKVIELKEKLIEQKRLEKSFIAEQVLFTEESTISECKIGEICDTFSGGTPSRKIPEYYNGNIQWIKSGELNCRIINATGESISISGLNNSSAKMVKPGTLLIAMYGATAGAIAFSGIEAAINQAILAIIPIIDINSNYLYYALESKIEKLVNKYTQGGQPNLNAQIIKSFKIKLPDINEQNRICNILQIKDKEIELLEQELEQEKQKKKALMQLLLTGIVRV